MNQDKVKVLIEKNNLLLETGQISSAVHAKNKAAIVGSFMSGDGEPELEGFSDGPLPERIETPGKPDVASPRERDKLTKSASSRRAGEGGSSRQTTTLDKPKRPKGTSNNADKDRVPSTAQRTTNFNRSYTEKVLVSPRDKPSKGKEEDFGSGTRSASVKDSSSPKSPRRHKEDVDGHVPTLSIPAASHPFATTPRETTKTLSPRDKKPSLSPRSPRQERPYSRIVFEEKAEPRLGKFTNYCSFEIEAINSALKFIIEQEPKLIPILFQTLSKTNTQFILALFRLSIPSETTLPLLTSILKRDFNDHNKIISWREIKYFYRLIGSLPIRNLIGQELKALATAETLVDYGNRGIDENEQHQFVQIFNAFFNHLISETMVDNLPYPLRYICWVAHEIQKEKDKESVMFHIKDLLLEFWDQALLSPDHYLTLPKGVSIKVTQLRTLQMISKVFHMLYSGHISRTYLVAANETYGWTKKLAAWCEDIVSMQFNPASVYQELFVPDGLRGLDFKDFHSALWKAKANIMEALNEEKKSDLTRILSPLGEPKAKEAFWEMERADQDAVLKILVGKGKEQEVLLCGYVLTQGVNKKVEVILVITTDRFMILKPGSYKQLVNVHHVTVSSLHWAQQNIVEIGFGDQEFEAESGFPNEILYAFYRSRHYHFPGMPKSCTFQIKRNPALQRIEDLALGLRGGEGFFNPPSFPSQECDSIALSYQSLCDYYQIPVNKWILADLATLSSDTDSIDVGELLQLNAGKVEHVAPIVHAVAYNRMIKHLKVHSLEMNTLGECTIVLQSLEFVHKVKRLLTFSFAKITSKPDISQIFKSLQATQNDIPQLDFHKTPITDKLVFQTCIEFFEQASDFEELNLSGCFIPENHRAVFQSLTDQTKLLTLRDLKWSNTNFGETSLFLVAFLTQARALEHLTLSECVLNFDHLSKVTFNQLRTLDLEASKITDWDAFEKLIKTLIRSLKELNLNSTGIPVNNLIAILLAPFQGLVMHAQNNNLGVKAALIGDVANQIKGVTKLDLSRNSMTDAGITNLVRGLSHNNTLLSLDLSENFDGKTDASKATVVSYLTSFQSSICPLQELRLRGGPNGRLGDALVPLLSGITTNKRLKLLDISGHHAGDLVATELSRLLQVNSTLATIEYDDNKFTQFGFMKIGQGIAANTGLQSIPIPTQNISFILQETNAQQFFPEIYELDLGRRQSHFKTMKC